MQNCFVSGETLVLLSDGSTQQIGELYRRNQPTEIYSADQRNTITTAECISIDKKEFKGEEIYIITLNNGMSIKCSEETNLVSSMGFGIKAKELRESDALMTYGRKRATIARIEKDTRHRELYSINATPTKNFIAINRASIQNESREIEGIIIGE